jgi:hypothetical protein
MGTELEEPSAIRILLETPSASTEYTLKYMDVPTEAATATTSIRHRPPTISSDDNAPGNVVNVPINVLSTNIISLTSVDAPGVGILRRLPVAGAVVVGESKYSKRPALIPFTP